MDPIPCGRHRLRFERTLIMGIVNVTPDSFSDGGSYLAPEVAVAHARQLVADGADIIDIGGESSRPGAEQVPEGEELRRVIPVVAALRGLDVPISIDTCKPRVAAEALDAGASMINDITGLADPGMVHVAAERRAPVIIMHMLGTPRTMQENPSYGDVVQDIARFFHERIALAAAAGVEHVILDPGIGFGKTLEHNLEILRRLGELSALGKPVLVGTSRKSFIGALTGAPPADRLPGTIASSVMAIQNGAHIIRVHDVRECRQAVLVADAVRAA